MSDKYYVICGNYNEFLEFSKRKCFELWNQDHGTHSLSDFVYVYKEENLNGVVDPKGFLYGSWVENPNIDLVLMKLSRSFKYKPVPDSVREAWLYYRNHTLP